MIDVLLYLTDVWGAHRARWRRTWKRLQDNLLPPKRWAVARFNEAGHSPISEAVRFRWQYLAERWVARHQRYDNLGRNRLQVYLLKEFA